jgi:hypothetical protein
MSVGLVVWLRVEHLPSMSKPSKGKTGREKGERERENFITLFQSVPFYIPTSTVCDSVSTHLKHQHLVLSLFFVSAILIGR